MSIVERGNAVRGGNRALAKAAVCARICRRVRWNGIDGPWVSRLILRMHGGNAKRHSRGDHDHPEFLWQFHFVHPLRDDNRVARFQLDVLLCIVALEDVPVVKRDFDLLAVAQPHHVDFFHVGERREPAGA